MRNQRELYSGIWPNKFKRISSSYFDITISE